MAKDTKTRSAGGGGGSGAPKRGGKGARTAELRKTISGKGMTWSDAARLLLGWNAVILMALTVVLWGVGMWAREQPMVAVGRVMHDSQTVRTPFEVVDESQTQRAREEARQRAPRVYVSTASLDDVSASIEGLPRAMAGVETLDAVEEGIRQRFGLTGDMLSALQAHATTVPSEDGTSARAGVSEAWTRWHGNLMNRLAERMPMLSSQEYQVEASSSNQQVVLVREGNEGIVVPKGRVLSVESPQLREDLRTQAIAAGFTGVLLEAVTNRLARDVRPTYRFDQAASAALAEEAASQVPPSTVRYAKGQVIYARGDVLDGPGLALVKQEHAEFMAAQTGWQIRARNLGILALAAGFVAALAGYTAMFCPRIMVNHARGAALAGLLAGATALAAWLTASDPAWVMLVVVGPTVFVSVILVVAYEQRTALAYGMMHGAFVCAVLDLPIETLVVIVTGVGVAVWRLREVRSRNTVIRMGVVDAAALGVAAVVAGLLFLPVSAAAMQQIAGDAVKAATAGLIVAAITLFILPTIEKLFDIVTGMTLIELRDPKQPLLRQLQQRAPGTYNHSLNVGSLGEAAAEAVGADGLLTYVGALYHDIGKMNKPEYFVENQTPGMNKHDKLSPAMSLLVIVGHVKDGMELAREFALPRKLHHFIEGHHGTTLVEYFYHRAKKQAAEESENGAGGAETKKGDGEKKDTGGDEAGPSEIEYRYPGPKPRTKEVAILMLCDAVESAARAMAEPTPARIDQMVRQIANKRLMDGQFDECELSLRELNVVVETVSRTLAAIYHGRIAYPGKKEEKKDNKAEGKGEDVIAKAKQA